jgi:hypothetical protein
MGSQRVPNFLIVGAAKAGTSTLWAWLRQHPDIFMSDQKETHFLIYNCKTPTAHDVGPGSITSFKAYRALFEGVENEKIVGEASPGYLCDPDVPAEIDRVLPGAKAIALLRDPVERAWSSYSKALVLGEESESTSFIEALESEPIASSDPWDGERRLVRMGLYGLSLQRYYDAIGADRIQVHLYEDLAENPKAMLARCHNFLGVSADFETDHRQVLNVTRHPRNRLVHDLLHHESTVRRFAKKIVPASLRGMMRKRVDKVREENLKPTRSMSPQVRQAAIVFFREDIERTQDLIHRDLSAWLNA